MSRYQPKQFETKWQQEWEKQQIYQTPQKSQKPKKYILDMFPYPSGDGLHVGHFKIYVSSDVLTRYFRLKQFNVLHPMGWDAFGLPAENYAIKTGIHPKITTQQNISNIKKQMQITGLSYDWSREINTTDPNYYKWTQWIFLKMFEKGLAYEDEAPINWCPSCKTGLANEEVVDGGCDRCGTLVEKKVIRQWILKITEYAQRLLEDLEGLDWPQSIIDMQVNWIGKSEGVNFRYKVKDLDIYFEMYDSVPQTFMAQTFTVIAPEHPQIIDLVKNTEYEKSVMDFVERIKAKKAINKFDIDKEPEGVFTGRYIEYAPTGQNIPIWVASFVIADYGSGVVNASAHDERDFAFAKKYNLPLKVVMLPSGPDLAKQVQNLEICYHHASDGIMQEPSEFKGQTWGEAREGIIKFIEKKGFGIRKTQYHLRDWIFSRQRYWGEPIPVLHCEKCGVVGVPESELPLKLPDIEHYQPTGTGQSPLASIEDWVNAKCPKCDGPAKRETNTMPQWAGSCWYYLRFSDPHSSQLLISKEAEKYWMPVDWYIGGAEHAVLHLLYARFWHKFLYDIGAVTTKEPFHKLSGVGLVLSADGRKMSKSLGNVVRPDDIIKEYGADTLRVYECFMGPFENTIAWDPTSINGVYKFLNRVWEVVTKGEGHEAEGHSTNNAALAESTAYRLPPTASKDIDIALNKLSQKVSKAIENMRFNTAVAAMMEFINFVYHTPLTINHKRNFLIILSPFAPHITEELWQGLQSSVFSSQLSDESKSVVSSSVTEKQKSEKPEAENRQLKTDNWSIHQQSWPEFDNNMPQASTLTVVIQVNGKVRDSITIQNDILNDSQKVEEMAKKAPKTAKFIEGQSIKKVIYVPGKIINFVV